MQSKLRHLTNRSIYNLGDNAKDANPNPKPNEFGKYVKKKYKYMKKKLKIVSSKL